MMKSGTRSSAFKLMGKQPDQGKEKGREVEDEEEEEGEEDEVHEQEQDQEQDWDKKGHHDKLIQIGGNYIPRNDHPVVRYRLEMWIHEIL
mgnify:CR=1 FL=1